MAYHTTKETDAAYVAGYDAGLNGPNTVNCHFSHFSSPDKTRAWEAGKAAAERRKESKKA